MANFKISYFSNVNGGRLSKAVHSEIAKDLQQFEGKRVEITIRKADSKRSIMQNALYWVYVTILACELGYTKEEMHEVIKFKFLKREKVSEKTGEIFQYLDTTTKLTKSEFADFITDLQKWSAENLNINLPEPGKQIELL